VSRAASGVVFLSVLALYVLGPVGIIHDQAVFVARVREDREIPVCI
jgi:hypothetical protein